MEFENLVEICFWLNLAVRGLRDSFWQYRWIFPNWPPPNVKKNRGKVHCKELVQNISTYFQRQKLEWTANTTTVQAPPLLLVDQRLRLSLYCWDRSVLSLVPYLNYKQRFILILSAARLSNLSHDNSHCQSYELTQHPSIRLRLPLEDKVFSSILKKYHHPRKLYCYFFSPQKLARLFLLKEVTVMPTVPLLAGDLRFFASSPALPLWYINLPLFTSTINIEYLVKNKTDLVWDLAHF